MVDRLPSRDPLHRRFQATVERYTPDSGGGRLLLAALTGTIGFWWLGLIVFEIARWGASLLAVFWTFVSLSLGIPLVLLTVAVLWPVYLSAIGNLESAADYPVGDATAAGAGSDATGETENDDDADPLDALKRRYASGEITEAEFERRLERLLEVDSIDRSRVDANGGPLDAPADLSDERATLDDLERE